MGCCVGEKHSNWCEDYDIVYIDAEGKEYCIFHAPAECKFDVPKGEPYDERDGGEKPVLMGAEQFNGLVFARIDGVIGAGVDEERDEWENFNWNPRCNFAETIFPYKISFSEYNEQYEKHFPPINLNSAQFRGDASFSNSLFRGDADFKNSQFRRLTNFTNAQFLKPVDFRYSQFRGLSFFKNSLFLKLASFQNSQFRGLADFISSKFYDLADFSNSQFRSQAYFTTSQFSEDMEFPNSQFRKLAYFRNLQCHGYANFQSSKFRGYAFFKDSHFYGSANFMDAETYKQTNFDNIKFFESTFEQMRFKGPVYFDNSSFANKTIFKKAIFHDYSNFEQTIFTGAANFHLAFFKEWSYFRNTEFGKETTFAGAISKETILMESVNLSNLKFAETNIESFKFIDCNWGKKRFAPIYDEKKQKQLKSKNTTLAEIYRRLKKIARESADEEQTSHWHYREKEMTLKSLSDLSLYPIGKILATAVFFIPLCIFFLEMKPMSIFSFGVATSLLGTAIGIAYGDYKKVTDFNKAFTKIYLKIYRFISGYGEEPIRAGGILFGLVIFPFIINFITSLFSGGETDWIKEAMWYMPLLKVKLPKEIMFDGIHYLLKGISVTLITLQAALFGFALRNKLRR